MPGHGFLITRNPFCFGPTDSPLSSTTSASMPGIGNPLVPGFMGTSMSPGRWLIMIPPVSVIHQVDPTGQFFSPTTSNSQCQAEGLIGSPTLWINLNEDRSCLFTYSSPNFIWSLVAVGVV